VIRRATARPSITRVAVCVGRSRMLLQLSSPSWCRSALPMAKAASALTHGRWSGDQKVGLVDLTAAISWSRACDLGDHVAALGMQLDDTRSDQSGVTFIRRERDLS
jgi:hypothetical protein